MKPFDLLSPAYRTTTMSLSVIGISCRSSGDWHTTRTRRRLSWSMGFTRSGKRGSLCKAGPGARQPDTSGDYGLLSPCRPLPDHRRLGRAPTTGRFARVRRSDTERHATVRKLERCSGRHSGGALLGKDDASADERLVRSRVEDVRQLVAQAEKNAGPHPERVQLDHGRFEDPLRSCRLSFVIAFWQV